MPTQNQTDPITNISQYYEHTAVSDRIPKLQTILNHAHRNGEEKGVPKTWYENFDTNVAATDAPKSDKFGLVKAAEAVVGDWNDAKLRAFIYASGLGSDLESELPPESKDFLNTADRTTLLKTIGALLNTDRYGDWSTGDKGGEYWQLNAIRDWNNSFNKHYAIVEKVIASSPGNITSEQISKILDEVGVGSVISADGTSTDFTSIESFDNLVNDTDLTIKNAIESSAAEAAQATPEETPEETPPATNTDGTPATSGVPAEVSETIAEVGQDVDDIQSQTDQINESATNAADLETYFTGGAVTEGVAEMLGFERSTDAAGKTTYNKDGKAYTLNADGELVSTTGTGDDAVTTVLTTPGEANERDFGQETSDVLDEFLYGAKVTESNASQLGFTRNADGTYEKDGVEYTLNAETGELEQDGQVVRDEDYSFTDYQTNLEEAAKTFSTDSETLRTQYQTAFSEYGDRLQPRLDALDANISALNQVATDAGSPDYYNRLSGLYYDQAKDEINRTSRGAQESLDSMYANAGLDPSSPAYTAAMMDLQEKRAEDLVSSRRQATLDSYALGGDMLDRRANTLGKAQTGITTGMTALGDLYNVKIAGLDADRDMITQIYKGKQNQADIGVRGLNTILETELAKIGAGQDALDRDIDLRTGLNTYTQDSAGKAIDASGAAIDATTGVTDYATGQQKFFRDLLRGDIRDWATLQIEAENANVDLGDYLTEDQFNTLSDTGFWKNQINP